SAYRERYDIRASGQDKLRIAAFGIDCQIGFCVPGASLFVPGAVEDTKRTLSWIYRHLDRITGLHFSMATHRVFQTFHPSRWTDSRGRHPAPLPSITHAEVQRRDRAP